MSKDLLSWETLPIAISPDAACDKDGAFSDSAWIETYDAADGDCGYGDGVADDNGAAAGEVMRLFYTGNVMDETHPEADGIDVGREAYEVMVTSEDGLTFSPKCVVLKLNDYPGTCTNHVRDPKVWEQDGALRMLLGARERDAAGGSQNPQMSAVIRVPFWFTTQLIAASHGRFIRLYAGLTPWVIARRLATCRNALFGAARWPGVSVCVSQGLREGAGTEPSADASKGSRLNDSANFQESASSEPLDKWQNIWQSGYFPLSEGQKLINVETVSTDSFVLWNHGFDFYAPQTFVDDSGRTILVG